MIPLLLLGAALASGQHTGIPIQDVEGLEAPDFQASSVGWTARIPHGVVRVYVAPTEVEARRWVERTRELLKRQHLRPYEGFTEATVHGDSVDPTVQSHQVDESWGDGDDTLLVRDGNLGLLVQVRSGARTWIDTLLDQVSDQPEPWPAAATVTRGDEAWEVQAPQAVHIAYVGGSLAPGATSLRFREPPQAVITWDRWGRATRQAYDADGQPIPEEPDANMGPGSALQGAP